MGPCCFGRGRAVLEEDGGGAFSSPAAPSTTRNSEGLQPALDEVVEHGNSGRSRPRTAFSAASSPRLVTRKVARASSRSGVSMPATTFASAAMPNSRATSATSRGARVRSLRSDASSASLASCSNSISVPLITAPSRSGTTRVAIRSHCRSPSEPRFSDTRTGSSPRTRSRRHEPAHLVEADHRPAQPSDVVARGRALLPAAPAEVVVGEVAAVRQVGGEQVLERCTPEHGGGIVAEDLGDVLHLDTCCGASLRAVPVEQLGEGAAPLFPLGPGDQPGDVVRRGQGGCLPSRTNSDGSPGPPQGARALGAEKLIPSATSTGWRWRH